MNLITIDIPNVLPARIQDSLAAFPIWTHLLTVMEYCLHLSRTQEIEVFNMEGSFAGVPESRELSAAGSGELDVKASLAGNERH